MSRTGAQQRGHDESPIGTLQSLIVAFVLAMTFRGFVTEGFVIPTGSMAPTLLGQHVRIHSDQTGYEFPLGVDPRTSDRELSALMPRAADPMLGARYGGSGDTAAPRRRMGDRILVLKCLYPFSEPDRFDVVVFKNPTNPNGEDGNYIKRLIGLPGEAIWLVDGDVFATDAENAADIATFGIARKPEHVQRAVWQPVFDSRWTPVSPDELEERTGQNWQGAPFLGALWKTCESDWGEPKPERSQLRGFRCDTSEPTELQWQNHLHQLTDWAPYNQTGQAASESPVFANDVRLAASIIPDDEGLRTQFELEARGYVYQYTIGGGEARVRMRASSWSDLGPGEGWEAGPPPVAIDPMPAGRPTNVEFWHVDQTMSLYVDGERVLHHEYDWNPQQRLENATGGPGELDRLASDSQVRQFSAPQLRWRFEGSPVTLERVRVDRDLYYRNLLLNRHTQLFRNPTDPRYVDIVDLKKPGFGTHPDNLAILGDEHFYMAGDNSTASSDSRLWGNPHPLVATQIDAAPFVVNRQLLLGKAWVVYFPSPLPLVEGGRALVPDFGRLRFIR